MIGERAPVTQLECKSLYTVIRAVLQKTAGAVRNAVTQGLTPHKDRVHTIAYDNGREFAGHEGMARDLETRTYFAHPYPGHIGKSMKTPGREWPWVEGFPAGDSSGRL